MTAVVRAYALRRARRIVIRPSVRRRAVIVVVTVRIAVFFPAFAADRFCAARRRTALMHAERHRAVFRIAYVYAILFAVGNEYLRRLSALGVIFRRKTGRHQALAACERHVHGRIRLIPFYRSVYGQRRPFGQTNVACRSVGEHIIKDVGNRAGGAGQVKRAPRPDGNAGGADGLVASDRTAAHRKRRVLFQENAAAASCRFVVIHSAAVHDKRTAACHVHAPAVARSRTADDRSFVHGERAAALNTHAAARHNAAGNAIRIYSLHVDRNVMVNGIFAGVGKRKRTAVFDLHAAASQHALVKIEDHVFRYPQRLARFRIVEQFDGRRLRRGIRYIKCRRYVILIKCRSVCGKRHFVFGQRVGNGRKIYMDRGANAVRIIAYACIGD